MKTLNIIHLGIGNVGKEVISQIEDVRSKITEDFSVDIYYSEKFTSKNQPTQIQKSIQNVQAPFVLIDTTASDKTIPFLKQALEKGGFVVLSNKKPLGGGQSDFNKLHALGKERLFYETTVGAGLPIIHTLKTLLFTGDQVIEIQGCFSGTLGYIFSELEKGKLFSEIVVEAKEKGYTEPDPRDDLSGIDVGRKALILSRMLGRTLELEDIPVEKLFPSEIGKLSIDNFLLHLPKLDDKYKVKIEHAQNGNKVLRYVATITPTSCEVGLQAVEKNSDIGNLQGPDNIIVFKTKRYNRNPIVIKGPGAGIKVTAAGVFGDVTEILKRL